uniref:SdhD n=1 Tax=Gracilaria salicornia TaxID=172968 RepID=W8DUG1_9FLOR|nr:SdhD [Gracilaria salicornia]AHG53082.1 SdhD [Gracilaria salicornia]AMR57132.1 SdhD [Gracilaria salicornia]
MFNRTWVFMRFGGVFTISGIFLDIEVVVLFIGLILLHMNLGLRAIVTDYIHIKKSKTILLILIRISSIEVGRYVLELLL